MALASRPWRQKSVVCRYSATQAGGSTWCGEGPTHRSYERATFSGKAERGWHVLRLNLLAPMATRKITPRKRSGPARTRVAATSWQGAVGSWTSLLAATTLGVASAHTVRAEVCASDADLSEERDYRLVVQSYDKSLRGPRLTGLAGRGHPVASTQRAITAEELRRGVSVDLLELRPSATGPEPVLRSTDDVARGSLAKALVVAWVEEGKPDLEYDARRARPLPGSFVGEAPREASQGSVRISIRAGIPTSCGPSRAV